MSQDPKNTKDNGTPTDAANSAGISLSKMAECFLGFGVDPSENITKLARFCGELLVADGAMYDRMDGSKMTRLGGWNLAKDSSFTGFGRSGVGYDSIQMGHGDIFEIKHYEKSPDMLDLAKQKHLHTYFGRIVKDRGVPVGALSVLFIRDRVLSDADREVLGIVAAAIAIEDKRLRAEEIVAQQQLKIVATAKMSALGEMAAGVAHEVNNPLLAMLMRIEQLRDILVAANGSEETIKIVNVLESLTMRISKIVKSLRAFSGDTQDEPFREVALKEIVESTIEFCGERFRQHHIDLQVDSSSPDLQIQCRPTELSRVLLNLLQNGYDAIEGSKDQKWIKIQIQPVGEFVEISVSDSGSGIIPEIRERIFLPFFSTKDVNRGKGLGLSVARGIVEKHHGTLKLDVKSVPTRFVVRLPILQKGFSDTDMP